MARVKLNFPFHKSVYTAKIPLRITDMNYGNHMGNDALLSVIHEARVQFLAHFGFSELDIGGCGLIMADAMIAYKGEGQYGDILEVEMFAADVAVHSFDLLYRVTAAREQACIVIAHVKTGMICFDYSGKRIAPMPAAFSELLEKCMKEI